MQTLLTPTAYLKNQLFKRAYMFLVLNWICFFLVSLGVLSGILPSFSIFYQIAVQTPWPTISYIVLNTSTFLMTWFLSRNISRKNYPTNLYFMLGFSSFSGWLFSPILQNLIDFELLPLAMMAFVGMIALMFFLNILSTSLPRLSVNLSVLYGTLFVCLLISSLATWWQYDTLDLIVSVAFILGLSLVQLMALQSMKAEAIPDYLSNEAAVQLGTLLFSNSLHFFLRFLRILLISAGKRGGGNRSDR